MYLSNPNTQNIMKQVSAVHSVVTVVLITQWTWVG